MWCCLKVVLANSKRQGSVRDKYEDEKMLRLFIMIPLPFSEKDVEDEFSVSLLMMMMMMMLFLFSLLCDAVWHAICCGCVSVFLSLMSCLKKCKCRS